MKRWILGLALAPALACLVGCSSSPSSGCQTSLDCPAGQVCEATDAGEGSFACVAGTSGGGSSGGTVVVASSGGVSGSGTGGHAASSGGSTAAEGTSSGGSSGAEPGSSGGGSSGSSAGTSSGGTTGAGASSSAGASSGGTTGAPSTTGASSNGGGASGGTTGAAIYGSACAAGSDCAGGVCLPTSDYWDGGYCSALCDGGCDPGGVCQPNLFNSNDLPVDVCLQSCGASSDCRSGYFCDDSRGPGVCVPQDCRVAPAACPVDQCNQQTGGCTATLPAAGYPATFPAPPQVVNAGGAILANPTFVPLFFSNDDDPGAPVADMISYFQGVGLTNFWASLAEYGVGAPAAVVPVVLGQAAPATVADTGAGGQLQQMLAGFIAAGTGGTPAPDGSTVYALIFPTSTVVEWAGYSSGNGSCTFGGYHAEMQVGDGGQTVPYLVIPRCPPSYGNVTNDLQQVTAAASHELAESSTDPFPDSNPAWSQVDAAHEYFSEANTGSEVADMCENDPEAFWIFSDFSYVVQRVWSNAAAAAGLDPCVPAWPGETFFQSPPELTATAPFDFYSGNYDVNAVNIPVGQAGTVTLELSSDAALSPWTVEVADYTCIYQLSSTPLLTFSLAPGPGNATCQSVSGSQCVSQACTGGNGDEIEVTITVKAAGDESTNGEVENTELFGIYSTSGTGSSGVAHLWWGLVGS